MNPAEFTPKSIMVENNGRYQFTFFCELCASGYTTRLIAAESVKEAINLAQREARLYFNRCASCRRWVCDHHYNEEEMMCTDCAPRRE